MSALPFLTATRVEVPRSASKTVSRGMKSANTKRAMTATMPRGARPASTTASADFVQIPRVQRISLENKIDDLLRGVSFSTVEYDTIHGLIICLKERKRKAVISGNYSLSQTVENMIVRLNSMLLIRKFNAIKAAKLAELQDQLEQAEETLRSITNKWNKRIEEFNDQQSAATKRLEREHMTKLEEFDGRIADDLPPNFCKLSAALLDLREQERQLVLTKRYDEAISLKKEGDRREKEEAEVQKKKYQKLVEKRRQKLIEEQEHAIECFTLRWTRQSEKLIAERDNEIATQQKIIDNINLKIEETESEEIEPK